MHWLAFLTLLSIAAGAGAAEINGVSASPENGHTKLEFAFSAAVDYHVFTMRHPERVVLDFKQTRSRRVLALPPAARDRVKALRHAPRGDGGLRVVLDLVRPYRVETRARSSDQGYRVAVELIGSDPPAAPAATPKRIPALPPAPTPSPREQRELIIAIDAGHGGQDVGAIGPSGTHEKTIVLAVARDLARMVDRQPGMRAVLTRDGDHFLPLRTRMERARAARADLFISIHADAFRDRRVRGSSVYVLSQHGASSEAAKWLADNENASDLIGGVSLEDKDRVLKSVLLDLSQTASIEASIELANAVLRSLGQLGAVHRTRVQHAGFMVLKSPDIPSILVETAFISNPHEERRLRSVAYRERLARAIFSGIADYFDVRPAVAPQLAASESHRHRVARGETLSGIADRYDVSVRSLMLANNMDSALVRAGAMLRIP